MRRALEKAQRNDQLADTTMDVETLTVIAAEVGVPAASVAEAIAESRVGVDPQVGLIDRVVGPKTVWSTRAIHVNEEAARQRIVDWFRSNHGLRPRVRDDGVVVAVRRDDVAGKIGDSLRKVQGIGGLSGVNTVQAVAIGTQVDGVEQGSVCLAVDVGNKRVEAVAGGSAVAAAGTVVVGAAAVVAGPLVLVVLPLCLGAGAVTSRLLHRETLKRIHYSVEETIDGVTRGDRPPHPLDPLKKVRRPRSPKR